MAAALPMSKGMDAANLEIFLLLHRNNIPLDRDVILLAEAGEEGTSQYGINFMVAQHWGQDRLRIHAQ